MRVSSHVSFEFSVNRFARIRKAISRKALSAIGTLHEGCGICGVVSTLKAYHIVPR